MRRVRAHGPVTRRPPTTGVIRSGPATAAFCVLGAATVLSLVGPSPGRAAPVPALGQIVLVTPLRVWDETGWMAYPRPGELRARIKAGGRTLSVYWAMAAASSASTTTALVTVRAGDGVDAAVVDRPLTPGERRRFRTVPLYTDADVLVVGRDSPACTAGVTLATARAMLRGEATHWRALVPGWPAEVPDVVTAWVPLSGSGAKLPLFDVAPPRGRLEPRRPAPSFGRYGSRVRGVPEGALLARAAQPGAVAAMRFSVARPAIEAGAVCALPVGGVVPGVATLRSRAYPVTRPVGLAFTRKRQPREILAIRAEYLAWVTGPKGIGRFTGIIGGW